jgi:hypothetical protein
MNAIRRKQSTREGFHQPNMDYLFTIGKDL